MNNFINFICDDITWCMDASSSEDCENCYRNPIYIKNKSAPHSFSHLSNTEYCPHNNETDNVSTTK